MVGRRPGVSVCRRTFVKVNCVLKTRWSFQSGWTSFDDSPGGFSRVLATKWLVFDWLGATLWSPNTREDPRRIIEGQPALENSEPLGISKHYGAETTLS